MARLPEFLSSEVGVRFGVAALCIATAIATAFFLAKDVVFAIAGVVVLYFGVRFFLSQLRYRKRMRALPVACVEATPADPFPGQEFTLSVEQEGDLGAVKLRVDLRCIEERSRSRMTNDTTSAPFSDRRQEHFSVCLWEQDFGAAALSARPGAPARFAAQVRLPEDRPPSSSDVRWLVGVHVEWGGEKYSRQFALNVAPAAVSAAG